MARFYMNVDGKELIRRLEKMGQNIQDTSKILEEAGEFMSEQFKEMSPKPRTGNLRASIGWRIKKDNIIDVGVQPKLMVGRVELYSWYNEFGTRKMAAQPYIRPGWEMNWEKVREDMINKFMDLLLK